MHREHTKTRLAVFGIILLLIFQSTLVPARLFSVEENSIKNKILAILYTEKINYLQGEIVTIFGRVTNNSKKPIEGVSVAVEVKSPSNSTVFLDIVRTEKDGMYSDSFRLSENQEPGKYIVYITAYKVGYKTASNYTEFLVSGFRIEVVGYGVSLQENNTVIAALNATVRSNVINSVKLNCRFLLMSPSGHLIYENTILKEAIKDEISNFTFNFILPPSEAGTYSYMFLLLDENVTNLFYCTGWLPAFVYLPPPVAEYKLGQLASLSSVHVSIQRGMSQFDSLECEFNVTQPLQWIMIFIQSDKKNFMATLNSSLLSSFLELDQGILKEILAVILPGSIIDSLLGAVFPLWTVFNVPKGMYKLRFTSLEGAYIDGIWMVGGPPILSSNIKILEILPSSKTATVGGTMSYRVSVTWDIISCDTLKILAKINGEIADQKVFDISILSRDGLSTYLTINAPNEEGKYPIQFEAYLEQSSVSDSNSTDMLVTKGEYNITVAGKITYWKIHTSWVTLFTGRSMEVYDKPDELDALRVTDIKVVGVKDWYENGKPKSVILSFNATNKVSGEVAKHFKFGEGVHYQVEVRADGISIPAKILIAGDSEIVNVTVPVSSDGTLNFQIVYSQWREGALLEIGSSVLKSAITLITAGAGLAAEFITDFVKIAVLYIWKMAIEYYHGFFTPEDVHRFLREELLVSLEHIMDILDKTEARCENPYFVLWSVIFTMRQKGIIDLARCIYASLRLTAWLVIKAVPHLKEIFIKAMRKYLCKKFHLTFTKEMISKIKELTFEGFIKTIKTILSLAETFVTLWRYFASPLEEGKGISDSKVDTKPAVKVDPKITIFFSGLVSEINMTYFRNLESIDLNITKSEARLFIEVDPELTSTYLLLLSDESYVHNLLRGFGFNSDRIDLVWENGTNIFNVTAKGAISPKLIRLHLSLNSTHIDCEQAMSLDAIRIGPTAWLNCSFTYPFGKKLNYSIKVELPNGSKVIDVFSEAECAMYNNYIVWDTAVDEFAVHFTLYGNDTTPPFIETPKQHPPFNLVMPNQTVIVSVNITDDLSGVRRAILSYSITNGETWVNITMLTQDGITWIATIPGFPKDTIVQYKVIAYDNAGNVALNNNAGKYYIYTVIPELPSIILLLMVLVALLLMKIYRRNDKEERGFERGLNANPRLHNATPDRSLYC